MAAIIVLLGTPALVAAGMVTGPWTLTNVTTGQINPTWQIPYGSTDWFLLTGPGVNDFNPPIQIGVYFRDQITNVEYYASPEYFVGILLPDEKVSDAIELARIVDLGATDFYVLFRPQDGKVWENSLSFRLWAQNTSGGISSKYNTITVTQPIPEPGSTLLFLGMAFVPIALSYRRWQK